MLIHWNNTSEADFMNDGSDYVEDDFEDDDDCHNGYIYNHKGGVTIFIKPGETKEEAFERFIEDSSKSKIWQMKNGQLINVSKMTNSHLKNTINMLRNKSNAEMYKPWIKVLETELRNRTFALHKT